MLDMRKILYIGWVGHKNLGDELMVELFEENVLKMNDPYEIKRIENDFNQLRLLNYEEWDVVVLGGGSILSNPYFVLNFLLMWVHRLSCWVIDLKCLILQ